MRSLMRVAPWLAVATTVLLGLACFGEAWSDLRSEAGREFAGFLTYRSGAVAPLARAAWPGRTAGVAPRDVVRAIDGAAVEGGVALQRRLHEHGAGLATITLERPSGPRYSVRLPVARLGAADLAYTFALPFSIGLLYLLLGGLIYTLKRDLAAALTLALCLVAAAFYLTMFDAHADYRFARVWLLYPLLGPLSVHLFAIFPERRAAWDRPAVLLPLYGVGVAVTVWREATLDDPAASDRAALASAVLLAGEFLIDLALLEVAWRRGASPAVRNRAETTFIGMALTISLVIVWQFAARSGAPAMTADRAMLTSALFPLLIAYALLRRDLFDVDAVLRASLVYGLASGLVIAVYFAASALLGSGLAPLFARAAPGLPRAVPVVSTLVAAALFHPVRLRVQRGMERLLLRRRTLSGQSVAEELAALAAALPERGDAAAIAGEAVARLQRLSGARGAALLLWNERGDSLDVTATAGQLPDAAPTVRLPVDPALAALLRRTGAAVAVRDLPRDAVPSLDVQLAALGSDLLVPLRARGQLVGLLSLAPRRAGVYRSADLDALARAAPTVALAIDHGRLAAERAGKERLAALGELAAVIIHEVKNPLGIIKVSSGTLRRRASDELSAELLRCVEEEVDRMDRTCRRLLELARPPNAEPRPCDLAVIARDTASRVAPELAANDIRIEISAEAPLPLRADAEALHRLLLNLLQNARDAMAGGGTVTMRVTALDGFATLVVEDTGHGFNEQTRRQLFRPFFTTRHGGSGLGLAIVKRIVDDHHGTIDALARPGQGARFTVTLPIA